MYFLKVKVETYGSHFNVILNNRAAARELRCWYLNAAANKQIPKGSCKVTRTT
jgi:hypothetical protein